MQNLSLTRKNGEYILVEKVVIMDRETRIALNELLKERKELMHKVHHNVAEAKRLRKMLREKKYEQAENDENNVVDIQLERDIRQLEREIRHAETLIATQKRRAKSLTNPNIAKAAELTYAVVAHQARTFKKCEYIL